MASLDQWLEALKQADEIKKNFKGKQVPITNYIEGCYKPKNYLCEVIQVNPCEPFDDKDKFDFYVVVADIRDKNSYQHSFPLVKIKDWLT